jgi:lipooligosaccharide transport system ATP-binding protein
MPLLSAQGLRKTYGGQAVVDGVHLAIEAGECFGLLGPNGAGKTTTLRLLLGLVQPDGGEIRMFGLPVPQQARQARMRVGVVPQMDNLDPDFTVAENLLVYGRYFGLADTAIRARIPDLLAFADLGHKADAKINTLSGGMKRRLTLARALVNDPDLIFLDEPTTGLDPQARHMMWQRLRQLTGNGKTILLTTHFMDEAERLADRLAVMDHGKIIETDSPRQLVATHIEPQVVEIYGENDPVLLQQYAERHCDRHEISGETLFCYTRNADPLLAELHGQPGVRYLSRPANLEDVFIKLTGRELRD